MSEFGRHQDKELWWRFYRAMHYRCKARYCDRTSFVRLWWSWPHRLKILETIIARTISPPYSLFIAQRSSTYSQGNMEKFFGENVRSTPTSITSGWIESTDSHVILGGGVAVCLLLSAHRAVISAIAQLSCCELWVVTRTINRKLLARYRIVLYACLRCMKGSVGRA